jgi:16S rRNA (guanine966-N2)-methyltransferase
MRVVAGSAKGRRLVAPLGQATRPTSDRVREATFNALHSLGVVEGAVVLDLFAGSGALGIEALSRGAAHATFVDHDRLALAVVAQNLEATGLAERSTVVRADAFSFSASGVTLALLDPPYSVVDEGWSRLLDALDAEVVVMESDREVDPGPRWHQLRARRYGGTVVVVARSVELTS